MLNSNVCPAPQCEQSDPTQGDTCTSEQKSVSQVRQHQFLPALKGKKVRIRFAGGQPVIGIFEGYNAYEILVNVQGQRTLIFKHSIVSIEGVGR